MSDLRKIPKIDGCYVCGGEIFLGGCSNCGWSQSLCRCEPILLCSKCGVAKAYHDDKRNPMTNDHAWVRREKKSEQRCPTCGKPHDEKNCITAKALGAAILRGTNPAY